MTSKLNVFELGGKLGLSRKDVKNAISTSTESTINKKTSVGSKEIYKSGSIYGTVNHKEIYKSGTIYGAISPKDFP